jgi:hypothetical protein
MSLRIRFISPEMNRAEPAPPKPRATTSCGKLPARPAANDDADTTSSPAIVQARSP